MSLFLCNYHINLKTQFGGGMKCNLPDHQWERQHSRNQTGTILSQNGSGEGGRQLKAADTLD